jgi:heme/copper-type cytochrome/quinol oxidase subunit 1
VRLSGGTDYFVVPQLNMIATVGAYIMAVGVILFVVNVFVSASTREPAGDDPWDAYSLEWATSSPPPEHNFHHLPPIRSEVPLWDLKRKKKGSAS